MKSFIVMMLLLPTFLFASEVESQLKDQLRAEKSKVQMLIQKLKEKQSPQLELLTGVKHRNHCDDDDDPDYACVTNCEARHTNGQCYRYGNDFCGPDASCAKNCEARHTNGQCYRYGADICGSSVTCVENCEARHTNGQCYRYGADICY